MKQQIGNITVIVERMEDVIPYADDSDRAAAMKARADSRRREILAGRAIVRHHLGVGLQHDPYGAPAVPLPGTYISLSHARDLIALAVSDTPIGIDIEFPRRQLLRVATKFLTTNELSRYITLPRLLEAWTAKEAVFKAAGHPDMTLPEVEMTDATTATARGRRYAITFLPHADATIAIATTLSQ